MTVTITPAENAGGATNQVRKYETKSRWRQQEPPRKRARVCEENDGGVDDMERSDGESDKNGEFLRELQKMQGMGAGAGGVRQRNEAKGDGCAQSSRAGGEQCHMLNPDAGRTSDARGTNGGPANERQSDRTGHNNRGGEETDYEDDIDDIDCDVVAFIERKNYVLLALEKDLVKAKGKGKKGKGKKGKKKGGKGEWGRKGWDYDGYGKGGFMERMDEDGQGRDDRNHGDQPDDDERDFYEHRGDKMEERAKVDALILHAETIERMRMTKSDIRMPAEGDIVRIKGKREGNRVVYIETLIGSTRPPDDAKLLRGFIGETIRNWEGWIIGMLVIEKRTRKALYAREEDLNFDPNSVEQGEQVEFVAQRIDMKWTGRKRIRAFCVNFAEGDERERPNSPGRVAAIAKIPEETEMRLITMEDDICMIKRWWAEERIMEVEENNRRYEEVQRRITGEVADLREEGKKIQLEMDQNKKNTETLRSGIMMLQENFNKLFQRLDTNENKGSGGSSGSHADQKNDGAPLPR